MSRALNRFELIIIIIIRAFFIFRFLARGSLVLARAATQNPKCKMPRAPFPALKAQLLTAMVAKTVPFAARGAQT